jgi:hypothetical protein
MNLFNSQLQGELQRMLMQEGLQSVTLFPCGTCRMLTLPIIAFFCVADSVTDLGAKVYFFSSYLSEFSDQKA